VYSVTLSSRPASSATTASSIRPSSKVTLRWNRMLQAYVSVVSNVCCKSFVWMLQKYIGILHMLQWLYPYVANVRSQCFICFFRRTLQVCLSRCCICFTHMLQVFYLNVAYVLQWFFKCFIHVFFCKCFRRMFHTFHLSSDVCCKCCILMFQKQIRCCMSLLAFCFLALVSPPRLLLPCILLRLGRGPRRGMAARSRAHALPFRYAGK
jgi:hypothetical protein